MPRSRSPVDEMAEQLARLTGNEVSRGSRRQKTEPRQSEATTDQKANSLTKTQASASESDRHARARNRALGFLARREHAFRELVFKLQSGAAGVDFDKELAEQVTTELAEQGLQSDTRYADVMVRHRFEQGHGPVKIRVELSRWDVDLTDADCYDELDWFESCAQVAQKRFGDRSISDFKERARRQRFLAGRGFERDHIQFALNRSSTK